MEIERRRRCAEISKTQSGKVMFTFRGSSFGGCFHAHIAALRGLEEAPPPPHMQAIFDRGHLAEAWAKAEMARRGVKFIEDASGYGNQSQLALFDDLPGGRLLRLAISPDGLALTKTGKRRAVEVKSFSEDSYREWVRDYLDNERYCWQISAVVHGYRKRDRVDTGGVFVPVVCKKNPEAEHGWDFRLEELVQFDEPPFTAEQCLDRCKQMVAAYDAGEWPECVSKYPCRYPHTPPPVSTPESDAVIARYEKALAELWAATEELEPLLLGVDVIGERRFRRYLRQVIEVEGLHD